MGYILESNKQQKETQMKKETAKNLFETITIVIAVTVAFFLILTLIDGLYKELHAADPIQEAFTNLQHTYTIYETHIDQPAQLGASLVNFLNRLDTRDLVYLYEMALDYGDANPGYRTFTNIVSQLAESVYNMKKGR